MWFTHFQLVHKEHKIIHEKTATYSSEMNCKVERNNKTFTELIVKIILNASVHLIVGVKFY